VIKGILVISSFTWLSVIFIIIVRVKRGARPRG
jgi:hypothetical protein